MASQKISEFTPVTSLVSGDYFPVIQSSDTSNKRVDVGVLDVRYTLAASGVAAQSTANEALASGAVAYTALASGNAGISLGVSAQASGNAALVIGTEALASGTVAYTALASGNEALSVAAGKYDKTGGPISGPAVIQSQSYGEVESVISSGVCILDFGAGNNFEVTLTDTSIFASPVNASGGQCGTIAIRQDETGSRLLSYSGSWNFINNSAPTLTTTASGVDLLNYYVVNQNRVTAILSANFGSGTIS